MNLIAMALMAAPQAQTSGTYKLESAWSVRLEGVVHFVKQSETSVDTTAGRIDVTSGRLVDEGAAPDHEDYSGNLLPVSESARKIEIDGQPMRVVWENDRLKLAIDQTGGRINLYQIDAKASRAIGKLALDRPMYAESSLWGKPKSDWLIASGSAVHTGRQALMSYLILLSPPRYSPLRFIRFHDLRDFDRLLGVAISSKQSFGDVAGMSYTPQTPLAMGNAYTGKIGWTNDKCSWGKWVGPNVLARTRDGGKWMLLDGSSGKVVPSTLSHLTGSKAERDVRVVGKRIVLRKKSPDERSTLITCYDLIKTN